MKKTMQEEPSVTDADRRMTLKLQECQCGKLGRREEPTPLRIAGVQGTQPNHGCEAKRVRSLDPKPGTFVPVMRTEE